MLQEWNQLVAWRCNAVVVFQFLKLLSLMKIRSLIKKLSNFWFNERNEIFLLLVHLAWSMVSAQQHYRNYCGNIYVAMLFNQWFVLVMLQATAWPQFVLMHKMTCFQSSTFFKHFLITVCFLGSKWRPKNPSASDFFIQCNNSLLLKITHYCAWKYSVLSQ